MNLRSIQVTLLSLFMILIYCTTIYARNLQTEDINDKLLSNIKSIMNSAADPCEDFYSYSCGNWKSANDDIYLAIADTITNMDYLYDEELKEILEKGVQSKKMEDNLVYRKLRDFHESCKSIGTTDSMLYVDLVKPTDKDDWPLDGELWQPKEKWNVWSTLGRLATVGYSGLFVDFTLDQQLDASYAPKFGPKEIEMPQVLYNYGRTFDENQNISAIAKKSGVLMDNLMDLYESRTSSPGVQFTIAELEKEVQHFDFVAYFSAFLGHTNFGNITVTLSDIQYLRNVFELVHTTPQDVLIHTIKDSFFTYFKSQSPSANWRRSCVHTIRELVPLAVDYLYDQEIYTHLRENTDMAIVNVYQAMQKKFVEIIEDHSDELSHDDVENLKEKILKMKLLIGNLPPGVDDQFYEEYFQSWHVVKGDFYHNHISALKRKYVDEPELLRKQKYSALLDMDNSPIATPFYLHSTNVVVIPHAYIRFPMVHREFHELFLYAELGNSLGHEMMHGFDTQGVKINAEGKAWTLNVYEKPKFIDALECLSQEKTSSIDEKIADFSGFRMAYDTYFEQSAIPEFSFDVGLSQKQLFFIKFAQLFCFEGSHISYDSSHDNPARRVRQVARNSPYFEEIFSCPQKTDEPSVKKCQMW